MCWKLSAIRNRQRLRHNNFFLIHPFEFLRKYLKTFFFKWQLIKDFRTNYSLTSEEDFIRAAKHDLFEKIDCSRDSCVPICVSVRLSKHIDENRLKKAVELTADALPILKSRFDFEKCAWIEISKPDIVEVTNESPEEIQIKSFDTEKNPPLKIAVSRSNTFDTLIFFLDHGVSDAHGFAGVVYLITRTYKKLGSNSSYIPKPVILPKDRSYKNIFDKFSDEELKRLAEAETKKSDLCTKFIPPYLVEYNDDAKFGIISECIDSKYLKKIKSFAHENNATINDVLIAVYSLVLSKHFKETPGVIPMRMAVDLRYQTVKMNFTDMIKFKSDRYLSDILSKTLICTNYSVPIWIPVILPKTAGLKNILRAVTQETTNLKNDSKGIGSAALIETELVRPSLFETRQALGGPFVSNAGIIDDKILDFGDGIKIEDLLPYIHFNTGSPYSLAAVTWKGKITLSSVDDVNSGLSSSLLKETSEILMNLDKY